MTTQDDDPDRTHVIPRAKVLRELARIEAEERARRAVRRRNHAIRAAGVLLLVAGIGAVVLAVLALTRWAGGQ